jgi:hypothetical protein
MTYELGLIPAAHRQQLLLCRVGDDIQAVGFATVAALLSFESTIL